MNSERRRRCAPDGLSEAEIAALAVEGYYLNRRLPEMDWTKLFDIGMVQSAVRWLMSVWGASEFMKPWVEGHPTDWTALVGGAVALAALVWSYLTVQANK